MDLPSICTPWMIKSSNQNSHKQTQNSRPKQEQKRKNVEKVKMNLKPVKKRKKKLILFIKRRKFVLSKNPLSIRIEIHHLRYKTE